MDRKELLGKFIDSIINGDVDAAKAAFNPYISDKSKEILGYSHNKEESDDKVTESLVQLSEMFDALSDCPVKLKGDRVLVDGKEVGSINADPTDLETGIEFIENGGKLRKEFEKIDDLFDFLISKYTKQGNQK